MSNLIIFAVLLLWVAGFHITILNPVTGDVFKTFKVKPLYPLLLGWYKRFKGTAVMLVLCFPLAAQEYNPVTDEIILTKDQALRLELLARQGQMCNEAIQESQSLLDALDKQNKLDIAVINMLRTNIRDSQKHSEELIVMVNKLERDLAIAQRDYNIAKTEIKVAKRESLLRAIEFGSLGVAAIAFAVVIFSI